MNPGECLQRNEYNWNLLLSSDTVERTCRKEIDLFSTQILLVCGSMKFLSIEQVPLIHRFTDSFSKWPYRLLQLRLFEKEKCVVCSASCMGESRVRCFSLCLSVAVSYVANRISANLVSMWYIRRLRQMFQLCSSNDVRVERWPLSLFIKTGDVRQCLFHSFTYFICHQTKEHYRCFRFLVVDYHLTLQYCDSINTRSHSTSMDYAGQQVLVHLMTAVEMLTLHQWANFTTPNPSRNNTSAATARTTTLDS